MDLRRAISDRSNSTAGESHSCILTTTGGVKCWGTNQYGQLGNRVTNGPTVPSSQAVDVVGLQSGVKSIVVTLVGTCALLNSGKVKCWGDNFFGQSAVPTDVPNAPLLKSIAGGPEWFVGVAMDGSLRYFGRGYNSKNVPDGTGYVAASTAFLGGYPHTCGLTALGAVTCSVGDAYVSANLQSLQSGIALLAATGSACALTTKKQVKCWNILIGNNQSFYQTVEALEVAGLPDDVAVVANTSRLACAITRSNRLICWGYVGNDAAFTAPTNIIGY